MGGIPCLVHTYTTFKVFYFPFFKDANKVSSSAESCTAAAAHRLLYYQDEIPLMRTRFTYTVNDAILNGESMCTEVHRE